MIRFEGDPNRINDKTFALLFAWAARRSSDGYRISAIAKMMHVGLRGILLGGQDASEVEEMGWAFLSLEKWKQAVLWDYATGGGLNWRRFRRSWRISRRKFESIVLDLQDRAIARGLIPCEEEPKIAMDGW